MAPGEHDAIRRVAAARRDDAEHDAREHGVDDAEQVGAGHQALAGAGGLGAADVVYSCIIFM